MLLIVMGVSGCGKSTVGTRVADALGWPFLDGDDLHSAANVAKMRAGQPLDDADRRPWLAAVRRWMDARRKVDASAVIACSALKRRYRERLQGGHRDVCFVWLKVSRSELQQRLHRRKHHFMSEKLLDSQLTTLEPPAADESAFTIGADHDMDVTVQATLKALRYA